MTGEVIAIAITSALAAIAGVIKALNGFNDKLQKNLIDYKEKSIVLKMICYEIML